MSTRGIIRRTNGLLVALAMVFVACGESAVEETTTTEREIPEVTATYDGTDCVYDGPSEMTAERVEITFVNETDSEVWLGWWQLNDDVEYESFASKNNPTQGLPTTLIARQVFWREAPSGLVKGTGGLASGTHALACVLHIGTGMSSRVTEVMTFASVEVTG